MVLEIIVSDIRGDFDKLGNEINKFLDGQLSEKGRETAADLFESLNSDIEIVLNSSQENFNNTFENTIKPFGEKLALFSELLLEEMKDITKVVASDHTAYSRALKIIQNNSDEIGERQVEKISSIVERWMDYSQIISINLIRNIGQLSNALQKIVSSDIEKSNFGTLLSLACIFRILYTVDKKSDRLDILIKFGEKYSEMLESYADTIDILCNPEEMNMINSIDKE